MLRIAHARLRPQHRLARIMQNLPIQTIYSIHLEVLDPSSALARLLYTLLHTIIYTLDLKSANRYSHAMRINSEGSIKCMPTPYL